ncbi:MAG: hypothetical protein PWQ08_479 [Clostridiales bacterium]|nr:hypothetical protein [Clostridiales bacterium]
MKNKNEHKPVRKTKAGRVAAAVLAVLIVAGLWLGVSSVTGNPVMELIAKIRASQYLKEAFPQYSFTVEEVKQDWKGTFDYNVYVWDEQTLDVHFFVTVPFCGGISDGYERAVGENINTQQRLSDDLTQLAQDALQQEAAGLMIKKCEATYGYDVTGAETFPSIPFSTSFTTDMPFDKDQIHLPTLLDVTIGTETPDEEELARVLLQLKQAMDAQGVKIDYYTVMLELPNASYDVTALYTEPRCRAQAVPAAEIGA